MKIKIGQKVRFDPMLHIRGYGSEEFRGHYVTGTIVSVNAPHRWFSVEHDFEGVLQRFSFKFCDIGDVVTVYG